VQPPELSAIVLAYRSGASLVRVAEPLDESLRNSGIPYELVIVANYWPGEDDDTPAVAKAFARNRPHVRVVAREKQGAMGWDMRLGLSTSQGANLVVIDGDAQNPVDDVVRAFRLLVDTGSDVVKGRRVERHDGVYRRVQSAVYNALFLAFFRTWGLWDINGKPKGMTRSAYERLELAADDWFIDAEIVLNARAHGLRLVELPVVFYRNDERASLVRPSAIAEFARNMLRALVHRRRP
jgi:glycosyltransferase involved in cell wall biosynthesis